MFVKEKKRTDARMSPFVLLIVGSNALFQLWHSVA